VLVHNPLHLFGMVANAPQMGFDARFDPLELVS
jgi:hypothetical protein